MEWLQSFKDYAVPATAVGGFVLGVVNFVDRFVSRRKKFLASFDAEWVDDRAVAPLFACRLSITNVGRRAFSVRDLGLLSIRDGGFVRPVGWKPDFPAFLAPGSAVEFRAEFAIDEIGNAPVVPAVDLFDRDSVRRFAVPFRNADALIRSIPDAAGRARRGRRAFRLRDRIYFWFLARKHVGRAKPADERDG